MRKNLLLLISILCVVFTVNQMFAFAQEPIEQNARIIFMEEKGIGQEVLAPGKAVIFETVNGLETNYDAMLSYLYQETLNTSDEIDLEQYTCTVDNFKKLVDDFIYQYPCSFIDKTKPYQYTYYIVGSTEYLKSISFSYLFTPTDARKAKAKVDEKADEILSKLNSRMTDVEKLLIIHDEVVDNARYDTDSLNLESLPGKTFSIYGNLIEGLSVCQGYTESISYLLSQAGILHKSCVSSRLNHIWNYVNADGLWYHLDATWDDPTNIVIVGHDYFLTSDETQIALKNTDDFAMYGLDAELPVCSSKQFESGYVFNGAQSKFSFQNGLFQTVQKVNEQGVKTNWNYTFGRLKKTAVSFAQTVVNPDKKTDNVTLRLKNNVGTIENPLFFIAYYDNLGKMTKVETCSAASVSGAGGLKVITISADLISLKEGYAKLFLWNGTTFSPYTSAAADITINN